jgi:hypothetical protein
MTCSNSTSKSLQPLANGNLAYQAKDNDESSAESFLLKLLQLRLLKKLSRVSVSLEGGETITATYQ